MHLFIYLKKCNPGFIHIFFNAFKDVIATSLQVKKKT